MDVFHTEYQSVIGSIMYAMLGTWPDLNFSITRLAKFASNPSKQHLHLAQYVLHYIRGTKDYVLCYDGVWHGLQYGQECPHLLQQQLSLRMGYRAYKGHR